MGKALTESEIEQRLIWAFQVGLRLPPEKGPASLKAQNIGYFHDPKDWGFHVKQKREAPPTAREISEADEAYTWFLLVDDIEQRKALGAWALCRARGSSFMAWCFYNEMTPQTGRRRKNRAINVIQAHFSGKPLLHNDNPAFGVLLEDPELGHNRDKMDEPTGNGSLVSWASDDAFQPFVSGATYSFEWADKRNEARRLRRAKKLRARAA